MPPITVGFHFQQYRALTATHPIQRNFGLSSDRKHIHTVYLNTGNAKAFTSTVQLVFGLRAVNACTHRILVIFNHEDDRQLPKLGHVEAFVHLPLIGRTITEIGKAHTAVVRIFMPKGKARTQ